MMCAMLVYVGSYPSEAGEDGSGISVFDSDGGGGLRPVADPVVARAPSFLAAHPRLPILYAVDELEDGGILAFAVAPSGSLRPLPRQPSGGSLPIHLAVGDDGRHLLCTNWGSGTIAVLPLDTDGGLSPPSDVVGHDGKAYAHHVSLIGDEVTVVHMGACALHGYQLEPPGRLRRTWSADAAPASGPRHLAVHPSGRRYVADELSSTLST